VLPGPSGRRTGVHDDGDARIADPPEPSLDWNKQGLHGARGRAGAVGPVGPQGLPGTLSVPTSSGSYAIGEACSVAAPAHCSSASPRSAPHRGLTFKLVAVVTIQWTPGGSGNQPSESITFLYGALKIQYMPRTQ
jgi:hypothetical protein